jgi:hypothetical protein
MAAMSACRTGQLVEQHLDRHGRYDVVAGALVDAELPGRVLPAEQVGHRRPDLLVDEVLDDRLVDVAQVHQQLAQPPALQLGALRLERLAQRLGRERPRGDQPVTELGPLAGCDDRVDAAATQVDLRGFTRRVHHVQAAGRRPVREHAQDVGQRSGGQVALEHGRAPHRS